MILWGGRKTKELEILEQGFQALQRSCGVANGMPLIQDSSFRSTEAGSQVSYTGTSQVTDVGAPEGPAFISGADAAQERLHCTRNITHMRQHVHVHVHLLAYGKPSSRHDRGGAHRTRKAASLQARRRENTRRTRPPMLGSPLEAPPRT